MPSLGIALRFSTWCVCCLTFGLSPENPKHLVVRNYDFAEEVNNDSAQSEAFVEGQKNRSPGAFDPLRISTLQEDSTTDARLAIRERSHREDSVRSNTTRSDSTTVARSAARRWRVGTLR